MAGLAKCHIRFLVFDQEPGICRGVRLVAAQATHFDYTLALGIGNIRDWMVHHGVTIAVL
jgi:hypothetical protein